MAKKPSAFGSVLSEKAPEDKKAGKSKDIYKFVESGPGDQNLFDVVNALKSAKNIIDGELKILEEQLKSTVLLDKFVEIGMNSHRRPESFEGQGDVSSATITISSATRSDIDSKARETLESYDVDFNYKETVAIRSNVLENEEMVHKIVDALTNAGIDVNSVLEKTTKVVASDKTIDSIFEKIPNKNDVRELLKKVSSISIRSGKFSDDPEDARNTVADIIKSFGIFG